MSALLRKRPRTQPQPPLLHKICEATDFAGDDRWAAIRVLAAYAPADLDIGDEREVVMYLINLRRPLAEAYDIAADLADAIREIRQREIAA